MAAKIHTRNSLASYIILHLSESMFNIPRGSQGWATQAPIFSSNSGQLETKPKFLTLTVVIVD